MSVSLLGVRHHGPGSARAVAAALAELRPDIVLIEGPPEADAVVALAGDPTMRPPVALLAYATDDPRRAAYWPFAVFSPEWQALQYAAQAGVPARFCDLPAAHLFALRPPESPAAGEGGTLAQDPIGTLAAAAGYDDAERWWDDVIEHRRDGAPPFAAIADAMTALREEGAGVTDPAASEGQTAEPAEDLECARREAHMRTVLRRTLKEGHQNVAVVCGAWHVPALSELPSAAADARILRGLPKVKVTATWVPWTHGRLAWASGYGAGVASPGWYHHLFTAPDRVVTRWLVRAAHVLRNEGLAASSAHVIEAVRLAETLATVRGRPLAGLAEVSDAVRAVLCEGSDTATELVQRQLVVGEALGAVPASTPMMPLQRDLEAQQRRLRLAPSALVRDLGLDLRKPTDLDRSRLLHRLKLLGIEWGTIAQAGRGKGTFHEDWKLGWQPEFAIDVVEASMWGTSVLAAATSRARHLAETADSLTALTALTEQCLVAELTDALPDAIRMLGARAALDTDVTHLMTALPPLVRTVRYGDVRGTDVGALRELSAAMLRRICVGLPPAASGRDDDGARELLGHVDATHTTVGLLTGPETDQLRERWFGTLRALADRNDLHGLLTGRTTRLLRDAGESTPHGLSDPDVAVRMARALSTGVPPAQGAAWVEGFLADSGLPLVHDDGLLALVDAWLAGIPAGDFDEVVPLLRRTFSTFTRPERRTIGERVRRPARAVHGRQASAGGPELDHDRAAAVLPTVLRLLGATDFASEAR